MLIFNGHYLLILIFQLTLPCFTSMQFEAVNNLTILKSMLYFLAKKRKLPIMQFCCINPDCLAFDDGIVVSGFLDKDGNLPVCNFCYTSLQKLSLATTSEYTCIILCSTLYFVIVATQVRHCMLFGCMLATYMLMLAL